MCKTDSAHSPRASLVIRQLVSLLCLLILCGSVTAHSVEVIVNNDQVNTEQLSTAELRAIFSMRKRNWEDKSAIRVFVLPDSHPLHQTFCKSVLKVYPYVLREQWDRIIFSGTGTPPTVMNSVEQLRRAVANTPGAIGYVNASDHATHPSSERDNAEVTP